MEIWRHRERERDTKRELSSTGWSHFQCCNSQGWARQSQKPELILVSHMAPEPNHRPVFHYLPKHTGRELDQEWRSQDLNSHSNLGCPYNKWQLTSYTTTPAASPRRLHLWILPGCHTISKTPALLKYLQANLNSPISLMLKHPLLWKISCSTESKGSFHSDLSFHPLYFIKMFHRK